jgi:glutamyl-tRNA synthetase
MLRVRFAPSLTGFLHIGSARTFIFNWLYARRNHGTMILRVDDTGVERNAEQSLQYRQSVRLAQLRQIADAISQKGFAYRDFTAADHDEGERSTRSGGERV